MSQDGATSSLRDDMMRVLVACALLSLARAAPSVPGLLLSAAPTLSPGDLQAAAIDAQVRAEDQARAAADQAREFTEEKVIEATDQVKEQSEEGFWSVQDKTWQALDAAQTAEAKLNGAVASNADAIARSALGGVIIPTYLTPQIVPGLSQPVVAPIGVAPVAPLVYASPPIVAPGPAPAAAEKDKETVKIAEPEKDKTDEKKLEDKKDEKPKEPQVLTPLVAPIQLAQPWLAPGAPLNVAPVGPVAPLQLGAVAPVYIPQQLLTPVIKTQW